MTRTQKRRARRKRQLDALRAARSGPAAYAVTIRQLHVPGAHGTLLVRDGEASNLVVDGIQVDVETNLGTLTQVPIEITVRRTG